MQRRSAAESVIVAAAFVLLVAGLFFSSATHMGPADQLGPLALGLTIIATAALIGGHLAVRFGQAAVLGELLIGMVLGNLPLVTGRLQFIGADAYLDMLARIGMLLLLFEVGLGLSVRDLFAVGPSALLIAIIGTVASFVAGLTAAALLLPGAPASVHIFLGAAITATSVGITARVLKDLGRSKSGEAQVILGAAIVDDVLALIVLGIVAASLTAANGGTSFGGVSSVGLVMKTIGFLGLAIALGSMLTPRWFRQAARLQTRGALLAVGLCFCFLLSWAASAIGLSAMVGAFAAGLVLEDAHSANFVERGERSLGELLQPMTWFLVPVFFVLVGFRADLRALAHPSLLALPLGLTAAAILGKLACAGGVLRRGIRRLPVAVGMIPRGEVTLIFAAVGHAMPVGGAPLLDDASYTAIVTVVILTTLVTPAALKWACGAPTGARVQGPHPARDSIRAR